jgi:hypothetical protein
MDVDGSIAPDSVTFDEERRLRAVAGRARFIRARERIHESEVRFVGVDDVAAAAVAGHAEIGERVIVVPGFGRRKRGPRAVVARAARRAVRAALGSRLQRHGESDEHDSRESAPNSQVCGEWQHDVDDAHEGTRTATVMPAPTRLRAGPVAALVDRGRASPSMKANRTTQRPCIHCVEARPLRRKKPNKTGRFEG